MLYHRGNLLDHLRVELFVPGRKERVCDVESFPVQTELQHLRSALDPPALDVDGIWLLLQGQGQQRGSRSA